MRCSDLDAVFDGGTVSVVGLGTSNLPLIDFLLSHGARVTARDRKERAALGEIPDRLEAKGVRTVLGEGYLEDLSEERIFRSPGIRPDIPEFARAVGRGAILSSEMELFLDLTPATVIGITGSDGKTTTTTLTHLLLSTEAKKRGSRTRVYVGGNIGKPLLPEVEGMTADDIAVLELSSFQLQTMRRSPEIAAITNVTPNHLNWHTGMEEYIEAKTNVYRHAPNRRLILNAENDVTARLAQAAGRPITLFSSVRQNPADFDGIPHDRAIYARDGVVYLFDGEIEQKVLDVADIRLPGKHNLENYMTAIALCDGRVSGETVREIASTFAGVPHRLEQVAVKGGVTYINSSIDSTPTRTAAALSALREKPIVICGGYDKHIPFEPLADALLDRAKAVVLTGATATKIRAAIDRRATERGFSIPVTEESDFRAAVLAASRTAGRGDTVLLSPACASFDRFRNFEERGEYFRAVVREIAEKD